MSSDWLRFVAHYRTTEGKGQTYAQSMSAASKLWRQADVKDEFISSLKEDADVDSEPAAPKKKSKAKSVAKECDDDSEEETAPAAKPRSKTKKQPTTKNAAKVKPIRDAEYYKLKTKYLKAKYE